MWSKLWNLKRKKSFQTCDYVTFAINVTKTKKPSYLKFKKIKNMWPTFLHMIEIEKSKAFFLGNMQQTPTIYMQL